MSELLLRRSGVRDEARIASLSDAVAALPAGESARRALLTAELAVELTWSVPLEVREQMAWRAVAEARRADDVDALSQTLHLLAQVLIGSPHGDPLGEVATELIDVAGRANIARLELWGRFWRVGALLRSGRHGEADAEIDRIAWALKRHHDEPLDRVLSATRDGLSINRGERTTVPSSGVDDIGGLQALTIAWNTGAEATDPGVAVFVPFAYAVGGRTEDAAGALRAFEREGFQSVPTDHLYPAALVALAIAAHDTGAVSAAPSLERLLSPFAGSVAFAGTAVSFGPASYALGLLAQLAGHDDDAVRHLRAAIDLDERTQARPHLARAQFALARVLLARRWAGELDEAAQLLASARALAAELGMDGLLDELDALRTQTAATAGDRGAPALLRDRYEPQEMLRSGGQGQIVRALDHQHDRTVALKVRMLREGADRDVLLAEARVLLELTPPIP
jgi:tetratricopeptide (TPR) repeat protein